MVKINKRDVPGPFVIVDSAGEPLRDERGSTREFSTEKRATAAMRPAIGWLLVGARLLSAPDDPVQHGCDMPRDSPLEGSA